jgi:hypothetical protein
MGKWIQWHKSWEWNIRLSTYTEWIVFPFSQVSHLAVDSFFPQWNIWTQFLDSTTTALRLDSLEESHPIEVISLFTPWHSLVRWLDKLCITSLNTIDVMHCIVVELQ